MEKKQIRIKFVGNKRYHWHTVLFFVSAILLTGLIVLLTTLSILFTTPVIREMVALQEWDIILSIIRAGVLTTGACGLAGFIMVMVYANKIAGPLYRLKNYMVNMSKGISLNPLTFRSDDEFKDLAEAVNSFREKVVLKN